MQKKLVPTIVFATIGFVLTALTTVSLIFVEVPFYIYSNIAGIALVSVSLGGVAGTLFSAVVAVLKSVLNLTDSILTAELLKNLAEVWILASAWKMSKPVTARAALSVAILTLAVKPLYFVFYYLLNKGEYITLETLKANVYGYYRGDFVKAGATYLVSVAAAYLILLSYRKLTRKREDKA